MFYCCCVDVEIVAVRRGTSCLPHRVVVVGCRPSRNCVIVVPNDLVVLEGAHLNYPFQPELLPLLPPTIVPFVVLLVLFRQMKPSGPVGRNGNGKKDSE